MKRLEATEAALRHMLAQAMAAAVEYGANPNQWTYSRMVRAKAVFHGSMLIRLRSDAHACEDFAEWNQ